jgi:CheY-like chemotaxis protein
MTHSDLEQELQEALARLYDPDYRPSAALCALVGCRLQEGAIGLQAALTDILDRLEAERDVRSSAYTRRMHALLYNRYVLKLTQEETADRLHLSRRSVQRAQAEAVHMLVRLLWETQQTHEAMQSPSATPVLAAQAESDGEEQAPDWQTQSRAELEALRTQSPEGVADVPETLAGVLKLGPALTGKREVEVSVSHAQAGLVAAVHPVVLRQLLIAAINRLSRYVSAGRIAVYAVLDQADVKITLTGPVAAGQGPDLRALTEGMVVPETCSVEAAIQGDHVFLRVRAPSVGEVHVLAIDDNADMRHFYRRATAGTRYRIAHVASGREALERIQTTRPDIIILDVMLPDVDGWTLLMQLHEDLATRAIPVVVCSVVREEALAYSLGAAVYLSKPIRPRHLVEALDRVRPQA